MQERHFVPGVSAFAERYEAFIIDQWGVLHDGAKPYPGAVEAVTELRRRGKRVLLLSNSGRRVSQNRERLRSLGFDVEGFADVVTSGEATWQLMGHRPHAPWNRLGRRCYLLTHLRDMEVVQGLDLELVSDVADAEFIFASGLEPEQRLEDLRPLAEAGVARGLPVICSNPDIVAVSAGQLANAPGAFARIYQDLGGEVHFVGKPHAPIYEVCFDVLRGTARSAIVAIGDSLEHDIKGASDAGIDSAFVTQGIHAAEFPADASPEANVTALQHLCGESGACPTWTIPRLVW